MNFFNPMFDFTLCNYGGHVGGHAEVHQHGAPYIYTIYSEILFANNCKKRARLHQKLSQSCRFSCSTSSGVLYINWHWKRYSEF